MVENKGGIRRWCSEGIEEPDDVGEVDPAVAILSGIDAYTRADAVRGGVLVDVTVTAAEMGYRVPVAVTRAVWVGVVEPDDTPGQSAEGRLWDVLWMLHYAIRTGPRAGSTIRFQLYALIGGVSRLVTLKAVMGPGDEAEPVLTIMWPDED